MYWGGYSIFWPPLPWPPLPWPPLEAGAKQLVYDLFISIFFVVMYLINMKIIFFSDEKTYSTSLYQFPLARLLYPPIRLQLINFSAAPQNCLPPRTMQPDTRPPGLAYPPCRTCWTWVDRRDTSGQPHLPLPLMMSPWILHHVNDPEWIRRD